MRQILTTMSVPKRAVTVAAFAVSVLGPLMLSGSTSYAQVGNAWNWNCVNTPGGALCTHSGVPGVGAAVPNAYAAAPDTGAASAYAAVPNTVIDPPGTVFLPDAVANDGEVIGADPDPNVRLNLMRDPDPMNDN